MLVKSKCFWSQFKSLLELTRHTRQTECKVLASCWFSCCSLEHYERFNSHQTSYHMKSSSQGVSGGWREFKPYMYCTYGLRTEIKFHSLFNILQSFPNLLPNSFSKGNSKHMYILWSSTHQFSLSVKWYYGNFKISEYLINNHC